jgi:hypothetical protein
LGISSFVIPVPVVAGRASAAEGVWTISASVSSAVVSSSAVVVIASTVVVIASAVGAARHGNGDLGADQL